MASFADSGLRSVVILDSDAYGPGELFNLYREYLGKPVTEQTAAMIAETVRRQYDEDGFTRPGYTIADGGTKSGIVRIRVAEAKLSRVEFTGEAGPYHDEIRRLFADLPLYTPLRSDDIRQPLRLARRLAGLDVSVSTSADSIEKGALVLTVESDYQQVSGSVKLSNRGTREIGRDIAFGSLQINGLTGDGAFAGVFIGSAENSRSYNSGGAYVVTPAGSQGGLVQLRVSDTSLNIRTTDAELEQNRERYLLKISRPITTRAGNDYSIWTGLDIDNLDLRQDGIVEQEDRLRVLVSGWSMHRRSESAVNKLTLELALGLSVFGARLENVDDPDDVREKNFAIADVHFIHLRQFADDWTVQWDAYGQYSPDHLPSIKQFKVGGNRIGRGFEAAAASGNRGIGNKVELKRRLAQGSSAISLSDAYLFADVGSAWANDGLGRETAASAGLGMSVKGEHLSGYLEVAKPLIHADADGRQDLALFIELTAKF